MTKSWVYVVKCKISENKMGYYVGIWGGETIGARKHQHFKGLGSRFTQKYTPIAFMKVGKFEYHEAARLENRLTEYYMRKVGFRHCRGGNYLNMKTNCHQLSQLSWWLPKALVPLLKLGRLGVPDSSPLLSEA